MEFQILIDALTQLFNPVHLGFLLLGTSLGLLIGVLPGLGGVAGLSLLLPNKALRATVGCWSQLRLHLRSVPARVPV